MASVIIIGAGMAGLACGQGLQSAGHKVVLLDKGRGAGGRMAARRITTPMGDVTFDHGAQYFVARDPDFQAQVRQWADAGIVAPWAPAGEEAWVGMPAMNTPLKTMASDLEVHWGTRVTALSRTATGWAAGLDDDSVVSADAVVTALPAEQTADLLDAVDDPIAALARATPSAPCWTLMLAFSEPLATGEDCIRGRDEDALGWAARNSSKPGRGETETWVIQAGATWSAEHLEALPEGVGARMMETLSARLGVALPEPSIRMTHRWRFARSGHAGRGALWNRDIGLGACGDWLIGPRVEDAWRSGAQMARRMAADLG